jgi:hypothetical protein
MLFHNPLQFRFGMYADGNFRASWGSKFHFLVSSTGRSMLSLRTLLAVFIRVFILVMLNSES